ncbi:hypothetical protein SEMRO_2028_G311750.1 [Seminavis robusta]|uniref:Uncharacterized protein n=1 Tax=Seminavis robusta TaxID=568900 RepID=A0A9N8EUY1_9STRA|nr:hypothetical protein SEMRO_2028_G311750.1 [Seminavis robusta]|eukprot:Sro2028_g311750.1 n/a (105) ;mRNA; r:3-317
MTALRLDAHASVMGGWSRLNSTAAHHHHLCTFQASALDFIVKFNRNFKRYNDAAKAKTERITEETKKTLLQRALSDVPLLHAVTSREIERMTLEHKPGYNFEEY